MAERPNIWLASDIGQSFGLVGALIDAGSATGAAPKELFRIASVAELRVFVAVPETYAPAIRNGDIATLTLDEYPGQQFSGKPFVGNFMLRVGIQDGGDQKIYVQKVCHGNPATAA